MEVSFCLYTDSFGVFSIPGVNYPDNLFQLYKRNTKIGRLLRAIIFKFNFPFYGFLFGKRKNNLAIAKKVILIETNYFDKVYKYIIKKNPSIKLYFYYWNPTVRSKIDFRKVQKYANVYTFDIEDSNKNYIAYNSNFYIPEVYNHYRLIRTHGNKILFIGADKEGRYEKLVCLQKRFLSLNLYFVAYLYSLDMNKSSSNNIYIIRKPYSYDDYLKITSNYDIIMEILDNKQSSMTLRVFESYNLHKKLITNNINIKNESIFDKRNIFVYNSIDDFSSKDFAAFISANYVTSNKGNYYSYNERIKRFI